MKKVITGDELINKMQEAVSLLCGTVKQTLGPKGNNVIIDHSTFNPFITNDGVTIAENIESDDEVVNTILELAKEASIKTNDNVGDGTTTTLVLLESIFNLGLSEIKKGSNPLLLKRNLDLATKQICQNLEKKSLKPRKKDYKLVASISANDDTIGSLVSEVYNKIKIRKAIFLKESDKEETAINYNKGYFWETILASPYFLTNKDVTFDNPYILIFKDELNDIENVSEYLNIIIKEKSSLVIVAKDYSDLLINEIISLYLNENINIILLKNPFYGIQQQDFVKDLEVILNGTFNKVKKIIINKENVLLNLSETKEINQHIQKLKDKKKVANNEEKDYLDLRLAMFTNGTADIIIGAPTTTERREKKMRFEDALWACDGANKGVLLGSGLSLLEISDKINNTTPELSILKESLKKPLEQILINSGEEKDKIINNIRTNNYKIVFNVTKNTYENIENTSVIDPKEVVINSLKNAVSIAGMLLTTSSLIVNEYKNEINKINDYNEY